MKLKQFIFAFMAMLLCFSVSVNAQNVAKVGNTEYATIDEAIAVWDNNSTLTLLADVTLSDVVTLKSTEHHILDLGTYTMTAASGKNAFVIKACGTGDSERTAITINADATNPGGINAGSKCVVYYKYADGGISTNDRPIIKINGGVFTGATSTWGTAGIYTIGTAARKCATLNITGGTFNCSINGSGKSKLIVSGGVFNYSVGSQGDSTALRLISGGTFKTFGFMTADSNNTKFWFGTSMANSNVGVYVDDNGYIVVGGPVNTEAGDKFKASSENYSGASNLLQYSSAKDNGLYYTDAVVALNKNNTTSAKVTVYVDELDMTGISYKGTIVVPEGNDITITNAPSTLKVQLADGTVLTPNANGTVATKLEVATLAELQDALASTTNVPIVITAQIEIPAGETVLDLNGKTVNSVFNGNSTTNHIYALSNKGTLTIEDSKGNGSINSRGIYNYGSLTLNAGAINAIDGNGGYAVNNQSGSSFVMNGGVVAATNEDDHQSSSGGYDATALKVPDGCTATLNGGTINNVCDFTYAIDAAGTLNIPETSAITVNGTHGAIAVSGGVTTINAGTYTIPKDDYSRTDNVLYVSGGSLVINGGTFIGDSDTASGGTCIYDAAGKAVVNGGTFKGSSGGDVWGTTGTTIKGGTFENLTETKHIAAGYELGEDGTVAAKPVAQIGDTPYYTFAEAVAAAQAGDEIVMLADATVEGTLALPAGIKLTSNGHTINGSIRMLGNLELNGPLTITGGLWVGKSGETLTATLSGDKLTANYFMFQRGTYTIDADIDAVYGYLSFEGTFEVNSTIHTTGANGEVLYINGNVNLNDGAVLDSDNSVFVNNNNAVLTLKPGSKVDSNVNITASGAKLIIDATGMAAGASANITGTVTNSGNGTIAVEGNDNLEAKIVDGKVVLAAKPVAKIGETTYTALEAAFAAATEGQTITLVDNATPALTSQRAITKAAVIDLGGKTMTLKEDDLYFGTTTFKNGTIVVDPSVKPSTAVFWMFAKQTLTFNNVKIVATGVTGTYLIGLEGENSDLNLLNGSEILVENTSALDLDIICVNGTNTCDIKVENSKVNVTNIDGRVFFRGNYTVKDSEVNLAGITKAGFRIEAGQTLSIEGTSKVNIEGEPRDGGIHLTDLTATYTKAETATVNATVNEPKVAKVGENTYRTLAQAVAAVEDGGTITLIANETFTENNRYNNGGWWDGLGYSGDKSFTIDLAGFTISQDGALNDYLMWFKNDGAKANTITLKNGTLDAGTSAYCALATASSNAQKITVNLENIQLINNNSDGATLKIRGGAELNANAGTIITGKNSYLGIEAVGKTTVVNIYEGAEIYQNGTSSYCGCLAGASGNSTINVYGGKGQSKSGGFIAMTSGGTINIEGGEWTANTDGTYANGNKSVLIAQSDKQYNAGAGNAVVNVTGGTFKGGYNCYGNKVGDAQINISGGNFNADPTSYVAEDYIAVKNNGVWNVELAAAKIGTTAYATFADALAAVKGDETLTLLADLNLKEILTINKAITFDGNGKTLTSTAARAINVSDANGVTIKNLTINASGERAINVIQNATNVTIENVTATAANYTVNVAASAPNAVVAIKNSTLNGLCTVNVAAAGAKVTVDNSIVNCNDNNTTAGESYAALCLNKAAVGASIVATNTTVNVTEGSDSEKGRNGAENGTVTINGSTEGVTVTVAVITYPGSDNYHGFTSLADAIEFAKTGDVVTLIRDVTVAEKITIAKSITLDGNGKTITYTGSDRAIDVPANADAKVNVTIENLTVDCTASYCQRGINYNDDGALTLEGVTVKGTKVTYALNLPGSSDNCEVAINNSSLTGNIALNVWGEKSTINAVNTTFTAVDNNTVEGYAAVKLNNDGTTSAEGTVINITGGKIDVTGSAAEDTEAVSNGTSTGKINISDSTVVNGKIATLVAVIRYADGNSYSFMTIEDAIAKAQAGETVTLLRDITASNIITINKAITLDLNGKKVTSTAKKAFEVHADATIKNGAIEAVQRCVDTRKAVKLTLTGVELVAKSTTYGNPQPLTIGGSDNGTEVTMENVEINAGTAGYGIITFVETELTATNSTIGGYNALYVKPGSDNSVFNFVDSDLSGSTVGNDVEGNSFSVIAVRANNVTVNVDAASTVTAAGNYSYAISFKSKSDIDTPATGSSVTVAGTITGNILADLNGNTVKVKAEYADELAAAGYATIEAENGLVAAIKAVAKIGETYYATLAEAFAVAQDGETITVLQDIEVSETLVNTKKVTLNLNGKTISQEKECTASYEMINNKGNLTITGNGKLSFKDTSAGDPNFGWGSYTVRNEGTLVVENGTIEHLGAQTFATHMICAIFQYSGSTTINGGTISTPNYRSARLWKGDMTINGGTFDGQLWVQAVDNTAKLTINGGTFEPNGGDASAVFVTNNQYDVQFAVTDGTFNGKVGCSDATKLAGAITGGKFNEAAKNGTNAALLATGFIFGEATDGYYEVKDDPSTLYIANLNDLKAFRDSVNTGANYYAGVNVYLAADIDMTGENWVGIGSMNAEHGFMGNFDGKNFKIKNLTITNPALDSDGYAYAGLFALTEGTDKDKQNVVKNLTIENVTINTTGHIASAAIAYAYYTIVDNVKVCGDIKIQGGNYTAGVLAYTRRCVNASNLSIVGNEGSFVKGNQTVGGVISDIQMNGGLTAVYNNFSAEGLTISGEKSVGGISGIIATQTLDGATVKDVTLSCSDARVGIVSGCLGGTSTISNVTYENVTGATALIGASYKDAKAVAAKIGDTYYATLEDALAAESNEVVELLVPYVVAKGETVTLDLNGKTVTGTPSEAKAYAVITNYGTLTISNGSVICNHTLAGSTGYAVNTITNCGTLTIEDATIENKSTAQYQIGYAIDNNSTSADAVVNIKGGKVVASGSLYYDGIRQFCNSQTKENSVVVSGGEVSTIWTQNPSDGATKNTKDVKGSIAISGGKVDVLSLEPSANFEAAVTGGHFGEISYFQTAEGRDLKEFVVAGTFDNLIDETFLALGYQLTGDAAPYAVQYTGKRAELALVDGELTEFVNENEIEVGTLTYTRSFSDEMTGTWQTLFVPFEIPVSELTAMGYEVAYFNDFRETLDDELQPIAEKSIIELIKIKSGILKANFPYAIKPKTAESLEMNLVLTNVTLKSTVATESIECSSAFKCFTFYGTYAKGTKFDFTGNNETPVYAMNKTGAMQAMGETAKLGAFRVYMTITMKNGEPYIQTPEQAARASLISVRVIGEEDENGATIIYDVVEDNLNNNGNDFIYDLQGRRVSEPKKGGIYIKNGKKILY